MDTEIPIIVVDDDVLVIKIPLYQMIFAIENRPDANYRVDKIKELLPSLKFQLENWAESNAKELGLSEFQYLLDRCVDNIYESATDVISEKT